MTPMPWLTRCVSRPTALPIWPAMSGVSACERDSKIVGIDASSVGMFPTLGCEDRSSVECGRHGCAWDRPQRMAACMPAPRRNSRGQILNECAHLARSSPRVGIDRLCEKWGRSVILEPVMLLKAPDLAEAIAAFIVPVCKDGQPH